VLYGAPFEITSKQQGLAAEKTFTLRPGEELRIGGTRQGMRAYLCIRGGFDEPLVLGSRSGLEPVRAGAELHCRPGKITARFVRPGLAWNREPKTIRVLDGAQADWFRAEEFYAQTFTVTPASNRMGLRLQGRPLTVTPRELISEPVCPGTVQVTRDGRCIILGVDGQVIGGYPKIAQVIAADLDRVGQLRPGDVVRFARVGIEEAETLYRKRREWTAEWVMRARVGELLFDPET
jgi:allophanate hydrolase subunit 2